jgi:hypothetical protein
MSGYDGPTTFAEQKEMAEFLAKAVATIPPVYRDRPADIFSMFLHAQSLNVPVTVALHNLVWDEALGKGGMTAQLMGGLLLRGGVVYEHAFVEDPKLGRLCRMTFTKLDGRPGGVCEWRLYEAVAAGIAGSHTWTYYADDMLFARCLSRGARRFAPDLILGFGHTLDELREISARETAVDNDRKPEPDVAEFLAQITETTPAATIQEMKKFAVAKKNDGLADRYAGGGQTVAEKLHTLWLAASAREMQKTLGDVDKAMSLPAGPVVVPGAAAGSAARTAVATAEVLEAPAGEGEASCRCPAARLVAGEGHDPQVCTRGDIGRDK